MKYRDEPIVKFKALRAINASGMPWQQRYVLFQLWELADARTGEIFSPYSYSGLALITGMSERAIQGHITRSVDEGWLERISPDTADALRKHAKNRYRCILRLAADANRTKSREDKTPGRRLAADATAQQMPTSQETTTGKGSVIERIAQDIKETQDAYIVRAGVTVDNDETCFCMRCEHRGNISFMGGITFYCTRCDGEPKCEHCHKVDCYCREDYGIYFDTDRTLVR